MVLVVWILAAVLAASAAVPPSSHKAVGKIRLELTLNKPAYMAGEPVSARVTVRNESEGLYRLRFSSGQRFDLVVSRRGALVWNWSHDKAFTQMEEDVLLRPGEALTFRATWDQVDLQSRRVEPGEYEVTAVFLGRGPDTPGRSIETPPLTFRIKG